LEVIDKSGDVVFQIQMQKDGVLYCGKFCTTDDLHVAIGNNQIEWLPADKPLTLNFDRIFKYPRQINLGIRVSN
jgi:hypothetical protein